MEATLFDTAAPMDLTIGDSASPAPSGEPAVAPAESGEVITAPPAAPDPNVRIAELEARITDLTSRVTAPVAPVAPFDYRQLTSALVEAEGARQAEFNRQQAMRADLQPPTFTEDEKAALVSDPDAILRAAQRYAAHAAKTVIAQLAPQLGNIGRKAEIAFELTGPNSDAVADLAFNRARDFAVAGGMTAEDYDTVSQTVYDYLWQASQQSDNPQLHFAKMTLNPQALATAARMAHTQRGGVSAPAIVDKKPVAPTVGAGTHRGDAAPRPTNVAYAEQKMGRKLTPADIKRLNEYSKKYAAL